jgi:hypothetical protein
MSTTAISAVLFRCEVWDGPQGTYGAVTRLQGIFHNQRAKYSLKKYDNIVGYKIINTWRCIREIIFPVPSKIPSYAYSVYPDYCASAFMASTDS